MPIQLLGGQRFACGQAGLRQGLPPAIAFYEYEHFPRGRVVYADRWLQKEPKVEEIVVREES